MKRDQLPSKTNKKTNLFSVPFSTFAIFAAGIFALTGLFMATGVSIFNDLGAFQNQPQSALAASELTCQSAATTPTWNPYPIQTRFPQPDNSSNNCSEPPLLSFFPVDVNNGNPREKNILTSQNFSLQAYYNNGNNPGGASINDPRLRVEVTEVSPTRWRISASLTGSNAATVTSAQKGGDLFVNVPSDSTFSIVARSTDHFPDAIERREELDATGRAPNDSIPDNSQGNNVSNPIYTRFDGQNLSSTDGFLIKPGGLEPRFLGYGFVLTQIGVEVSPQGQNLPPQIPGQEITIVRGQSGSFSPLNPTDPENDIPIALDLTQVLPFCQVTGTANSTGGGQIINCQTDANTPVRSQFVITPTDSRGLVGTPGTFIVNVIEPDLNLQKVCLLPNSTTECRTSALTPGQAVSYEMTITNSTQVQVTGLKLEDDYDETRITNINTISDNGVVRDGKIFWDDLGNLAAGASKKVTFNAEVSQAAQPGETVRNTATVTANNIPPKTATAEFPIAGASLTAEKLCYRKGTTTPCASANLRPGESVTYRIRATNPSQVTLRELKIVDDYDQTRLTDVTAITPAGSLDAAGGTITWNLPDLAAGATTEVSYDAVIIATTPSGVTINNLAVVSALGVPPVTVQTSFPIILIVATTTPRTGGQLTFAIVLGLAAIALGGYYYYIKYGQKLSKKFAPSRTSESKK